MAALRCTKFVFGRDSAPDHTEEPYSAPHAPSWFKGPYTSKGREGMKTEKGRKREGEGRDVKYRKTLSINSCVCPSSGQVLVPVFRQPPAGDMNTNTAVCWRYFPPGSSTFPAAECRRRSASRPTTTKDCLMTEARMCQQVAHSSIKVRVDCIKVKRLRVEPATSRLRV